MWDLLDVFFARLVGNDPHCPRRARVVGVPWWQRHEKVQDDPRRLARHQHLEIGGSYGEGESSSIHRMMKRLQEHVEVGEAGQRLERHRKRLLRHE